jgi:hypothetical protein
MALNLSTTGIVDGQIITAAQITQSINALTAVNAYNITISGSFSLTGGTTGSGWFTNAVSSSRSITASYAETALSSSYAVTASYAENTNPSDEVLGALYPSGGLAVPTTNLKFIVGGGKTSGPAGSPPYTGSILINELAGFTGMTDIGQNIFVTVTPVGAGSGSNNSVWLEDFIPPTCVFQSEVEETDYTFQIIYKP